MSGPQQDVPGSPAVERLLREIGVLVAPWRRTAPPVAVMRQVAEALDKLHALGWDYALGHACELDDSSMPRDYIARRVRILRTLEDRLEMLAIDYRGAPRGSQQRAEVVARYAEVVREMLWIGHWDGALEVESMLPDRDMPPEYHAHVQRVLAAPDSRP